jgi:imidazole glycerol-phosphate synthase subunit HisF
MLKTRIIPTMLYRGAGLVKGQAFLSDRPVGSALQAVKVYNLREVDELVLYDIMATQEGRGPDLAMIDDLADYCFMPLAVGGGVRTVDDFRALLSVGADKVVVNSAALDRPELVRAAADSFGSQCVVVAIDVRGDNQENWQVFADSGRRPIGRNPVEWARQVASLGAGEIIITAVARDGTLSGYDLDLVRAVAAAVNVPVIASGGAGSYEDFRLAVEAGAAAVAAGAMFHFTQQTPREAKLHMQAAGIPVRLPPPAGRLNSR